MSELPQRLLLGPGPSNLSIEVREALSKPIIGHLDPAFLGCMDEVQAGLRRLFGTENELTLPLSATGSAGMEACLSNLLEPGDEVIVGVAGVFGERMCEVAKRIGAQVIRVETPWGEALDPAAMQQSIRKHTPKVVAFVHAETSTGVLQPVKEIAHTAQEAGALVVLDCVTSLAGVPITLDEWGVDAAYSGTQKCLSCPPGLSPLSVSRAALARVQQRRVPVQSWYFDWSLLAGYFGGERVYHHTAPISSIMALRAGITRVEAEGMEARVKRHQEAANALLDALEPLGFQPLVKKPVRLAPLTTLLLPQWVTTRGEATLRQCLLETHQIEVGGGLGELAGRVWRVGLMGENATLEAVQALRRALEAEAPG